MPGLTKDLSSMKHNAPSRLHLATEGVMAALFSIWCLFWMIQPAIYLPALPEQRWFGLPAHYAFWLVGMVVVVPASCFFFTLCREKRPSKGGESEQ